MELRALIREKAPLLAFWAGRAKRLAMSHIPVAVPDIDDKPYPNQRLLIDITRTIDAEFVTGIQRVVLRLTEALIQQHDTSRFEPIPVQLKIIDGEYRLVRASAFENRLGLPTTSNTDVSVRHNDILFMLDSSWDEYGRYARTIVPILKSRGGKVVTCLYDIIPVSHPQYFDKLVGHLFARWLPLMLKTSDMVLCISLSTEKALRDYIQVSRVSFSGKISHFCLGTDFQHDQSTPSRRSAVPTVLMIGTLEPRKGHAVALDAFETLWAQGKSVKLHIIGKFGWSVERLVSRMQAHSQFGKNLLLETNASDNTLKEAYMGSDLVLATSFVEGFGLPLVEAAAMSKPLMVSDIPSHREVCAENAIYFEAGNGNDLASKLTTWLDGKPLPAPPSFISWKESAERASKSIHALATD